MLTPEQLAKDSEHSQQVALFAWVALEIKNYPELKWLYAIPNGFFSSSGQKSKMKAEGLRDGVPDLFLPLPIQTSWGHQYAGLYIEMKRDIYRNRANGGCSEEQLAWHEYLKRVGYWIEVCYNWEEARDVILKYLNSTRG